MLALFEFSFIVLEKKHLQLYIIVVLRQVLETMIKGL